MVNMSNLGFENLYSMVEDGEFSAKWQKAKFNQIYIVKNNYHHYYDAQVAEYMDHTDLDIDQATKLSIGFNANLKLPKIKFTKYLRRHAEKKLKKDQKVDFHTAKTFFEKKSK